MAKKKAARKKVTGKKSARKATTKSTKKKSTKKKTPTKKVAKQTANKKVTKKKTPKKKVAGKATTRKTTKKAAPTKVQPQRKQPRRTLQAQPSAPLITPFGPSPAETTSPTLLPPPPEVAATSAPATDSAVEAPPVVDVGDAAPDFHLLDQHRQTHNLAQYRGRYVVLYFYPRDNTPGCTTEACGFRDRLNSFSDRDVVVLGISPDDVDSHSRFADKYGLPFPLLADPDHAVAERYGVWVEKQMYGKSSMGIARTTFVIDPEGRIAHMFLNVRAEGHEQQVLDRLDAMRL